MRKTLFLLTTCLLISLCSIINAFAKAEDKIKEIDKNALMQKVSGLHIPFIQNQGQLKDKSVKYYANTFAGGVFITEGGEILYSLIKMEKEDHDFNVRDRETTPEGEKKDHTSSENKDLRTIALKESLVSPKETTIKGINKSETIVNYFTGDKDAWRSNIPAWHEVSLGEVYENVYLSLKAYGNNVEKLFTVHPEGNVDDIKLKIKGANGLSINKEGELEVETDLGTIKMTKPVAYQEIKGERIQVAANYVILNTNTLSQDAGFVYGFRAGEYDKTKDLVIDPLLASTCVGGNSSDQAYAIAIDSSGNVFIAGMTYSYNYPTTAGAYDRTCNVIMACSIFITDAFVSKFNFSLTSLLASTFIGGDKSDVANALSLDSSGNVFITGLTSSSDYPVTHGAYTTTSHSGEEVFVTKLSNNLSTLIASSFFGGIQSDHVNALAIDTSGNIFITGWTNSSDYPITPGAYTTPHSNGDVFVTKLSSDLSTLVASSVFGGLQSSDEAKAIALDSSGNVFITGDTESSDFPTTIGAYDISHAGFNDVFVSKLSSDLSSLIASSLFGGIQGDHANALVIDTSGNLFIAGYTNSFDLPAPMDSYDSTDFDSGYDVLVLKFNNDLANLYAWTYIEGIDDDVANAIALDSAGNIYIAGQTESSDFPTTPGAYDRTFNSITDSPDAFVARLSSDLKTLLSSTFIGGDYDDAAYAITIDSLRNIFVAGVAGSTDYPTPPGAYDRTCNFYGSPDAFVSNISSGLIYAGPNPVNFGGINAGSTQDQTVTVRNDGVSDLIIGNIAQSDPVDTYFSIITDNCSGRTIAPSASCTLLIRFAPSSKGIYNGSFDIPSNDPYESSITVNLYGTVADEDFETGDISKFPWITGGSAIWGVQSGEQFTGSHAVASPALSTGESSYFQVTLTVMSAGDISFWYKVSSMKNFNYLSFEIDGIEQDRWSGAEGWAFTNYPVTAGRHTFRWEYTKTGDPVQGPQGMDIALIDDITFPTHMPPRRLSGQVTNSGTGVGAVTIDIAGDVNASTKTDKNGNYTFYGLIDGSYIITPSKAGYTFNPTSRNLTISGTDVTGQDFAVVPPVIGVSPSQINFTVPEGASASNTLTITNSGTGNMAYSIITSTNTGAPLQGGGSSGIGGKVLSSTSNGTASSSQGNRMSDYNKLLSIDKSGNRTYKIPYGAKYSNEYILVKFKGGLTAAEERIIHGNVGATVVKSFKKINVHKVKVKDGKIDAAINKYLKDKRVDYAEPDYLVQASLVPNDPYLNQLWGLNNTGQSGGTYDSDIDAYEAWDIETGNSGIIVAVIDTGVDYNHEDLVANMWTNSGEVNCTDGIDDDGNGYIDDCKGWDFANDDNDPYDDFGHGTHCSGTIAAVGDNGVGVAGVNWNVKIMPLKFLDSQGYGYTSDAVPAVFYSIDNGAKVLSNSWGGGSYSQTLYDAIQYAYNAGSLFVAAAGNASTDTDVYSNYPSNYNVPNVISVAATDHNDNLASFSNFGATTVDLAAPGVNIYSTMPPGAYLSSTCNDSDNNGYGYCSGTSMATPHVAGVAALILSMNPALGVDTLKNVIMNDVDTIASLSGKMVSGGRLNARKAIEAAGPPWLSLSLHSGILTPGSVDVINVIADATFLTAGSYNANIEISSNDPINPLVLIPTSLTVVTNNPPVADPGGPYTGNEGQTITLDGSGSSDPDQGGTINLYEWDIDNDGIFDYSSSSPTQNHAYTHNGSYTIKLRVTDNFGITDEATTTATISDTSPTANFTGSPTTGTAPLTVNFANTSTGYDQPLTYAWDFDNNGTVDSSALNPSANYLGQGTYTVKLTVTDSDGSTNILTRTNYITATPPGYTLTINKTGTGSGTVTSSPSGIDCGSDCTETYSIVTTATLTAIPDAGSYFTGWSGGGCSGTGDCTITINAYTPVTAAFDACSNMPVRIMRGTTLVNSYLSLQTAYNDAISGDVIQSQAALFTESLNAGDINNKSITIEGGYDCGYTAVTGKTALKGQTTISKGTNRIKDLIIRK